MTDRELLALLVVAVPGASALVVAVAPRRALTALAVVCGLASAAAALALAAVALADPDDALARDWLVVDAATGLFAGVIGVVGLASVAFSPAYLGSATSSLVRAQWRQRSYYATLFVFWSVLAGIPVAGNLGAAWLAVEATTAASALLVGFSGSPRALEAAWKYLILTSLGLGVALLGIVLVAAGVPGGGLDALSWTSLSSYDGSSESALVAYVLLVAGLAAKVGWAPVHNWLPDAHAEAPPPVSALLSAALLPAVLLVAWRSQQGLGPVAGEAATRSVLIVFGLVSLAVAIPFLWRSLAWKRLLAYSSLEHMGVIALGVGFASPLALAGVAVHLVGHALAKALGFYAAAPLLASEPRAARLPAAGVVRTEPRLGATLGISLAALAGMPPSPLFASEVLIIAGGFQAGRPWEAAVAAGFLALGFLGLAHALIETTVGAPAHRRPRAVAGLGLLAGATAAATVAMLALTGIAPWLPGSDVVSALAEGVR